jgi:nucleotide-binding universal stress UspA family protein
MLWPMFAKILLAVDGSPHSSKTLPVAIDLAQKYGAEVTVLHVREFEKYEGSDVDLGPPQDAESLVGETVEALRGGGVEATGEIRRVTPGQTPDEIVRVAAAVQAELIVLGTRGMSELRSLVLGGVANKVVHQAHCPVLLVR